MKPPVEFLKIMQKELGENYAGFLKSYDLPPQKGIRVNTLKISVEEFEKISPLTLDGKIPWEERGFYIKDADGAGRTVEHAAGLYYVQEPSAMSPVSKLEIKRGERVLDLCAAPGGKATQIASYLQGEGELVANEPDLKRCFILESNIERMGIRNSIVTFSKPKALAGHYQNYFDKILVDAPCSGEGMFKKEENAAIEWSPENVKACARRQKEILEEAYKMLAGGGRMVYSTCTFSRQEDEEQIESFLSSHPDIKLLEMKKLYPHEVRGEGHFYAVMQKADGERAELKLVQQECHGIYERLYREWESASLNIKVPVLHQRGSSLFGIFSPMHVPRLGCGVVARQVGVFLGRPSNDWKRFEVSHTLAMALKKDEAKCVEVGGDTALKYLRGLTFECASDNGWRLVTCSGHPLGWCKVVNGIAKNHLPKGLRI